MKFIRIASCILACLCLAASFLLGNFFGLVWFLVLIVLAAIFVMVMLFAKNRSDPPPPETPDFMKSDEENERINRDSDKK